MENSSSSSNLPKIDAPATYTIVVAGWLDSVWLDFFPGLDISVKSESGKDPRTHLVGQVPDQAALLGLLNALNHFRLRLISVQYMASEGQDRLQASIVNPGETT